MNRRQLKQFYMNFFEIFLKFFIYYLVEFYVSGIEY